MSDVGTYQELSGKLSKAQRQVDILQSKVETEQERLSGLLTEAGVETEQALFEKIESMDSRIGKALAEIKVEAEGLNLHEEPSGEDQFEAE